MGGVALMEHGFYHPDRGYWQTISTPSADVLASYPVGTVEVGLRPSPYAQWVDGAWVDHPAPAPTPEQQKEKRMAAYVAEADPLFFKWQAGESTEAEWKAKRQEIRNRYPNEVPA